jgi:hypothetical protein
MSAIVNEIRRGLYLDSVALMRMSRTVAAMTGVAECGMMMGTPANMRIMAKAAVLRPAISLSLSVPKTARQLTQRWQPRVRYSTRLNRPARRVRPGHHGRSVRRWRRRRSPISH